MLMKPKNFITEEEFQNLSSNKELLDLIKTKDVNYEKVQETISYIKELRLLQIELVKLQRHIAKTKKTCSNNI